MSWFKSEKKIALSEIKEIMSLVDEKKKRSSKDDFITRYREFNDLKRELKAEEEENINEILDKYGTGEGEGESMENQLIKEFLPKIMQKINPSQKTTPVNDEIGDVVPVSVLSDEEINIASNQLIGSINKKNRDGFINGLKGLTDSDLLRLRNNIIK